MGCTFAAPGRVAEGERSVRLFGEPLGAAQAAQAEALLSLLPPEMQLRVLRLLDADALCAVARAALARGEGDLAAVAADASLWRRHSLTLCSRPWPPRPPGALRTLRVCSYRCPSGGEARAALAWLGRGLAGPDAVRRLELVGRNLDHDTLRACLALCRGARELSLHDVLVEDGWVVELAGMARLESLHLDWHTEMSSDQVLRVVAACPVLRLIGTSGCPRDCKAGRDRRALRTALRELRPAVELS